jgi:hypothetical protein
MSDDVFKEVQDQIDWAREQIDRGKADAIAHIQAGAFVFVTEVDLKTGEQVHKFKLAKPLPNSIKGSFRSAIVDLKHSFDMSLHAAAQSMGCVRFDKTYPWAVTPQGVQGIIAKRQSKPDSRLPDALIEEIWRQEPYSTGPGFAGGNDLIREVANMANEKHTIGITTWADAASYQLTNVVLDGPNKFIGHWDPIKQELELFRVGLGGSASYDNATVSVDILFKRAGSVGKIPAFEVATAFADKAQVVLDGFKRVAGA